MSNNMVLIKLEGIGETSMFLVSENVYNWVVSKPPSFDGGFTVEEILPGFIVEYLEEYADSAYIDNLRNKQGVPSIALSTNSYENDRALYLDTYGDNRFRTIGELLAYVNVNNITLLTDKEYNGCIY